MRDGGLKRNLSSFLVGLGEEQLFMWLYGGRPYEFQQSDAFETKRYQFSPFLCLLFSFPASLLCAHSYFSGFAHLAYILVHRFLLQTLFLFLLFQKKSDLRQQWDWE